MNFVDIILLSLGALAVVTGILIVLGAAFAIFEVASVATRCKGNCNQGRAACNCKGQRDA